MTVTVVTFQSCKIKQVHEKNRTQTYFLQRFCLAFWPLLDTRVRTQKRDVEVAWQASSASCLSSQTCMHWCWMKAQHSTGAFQFGFCVLEPQLNLWKPQFPKQRSHTKCSYCSRKPQPTLPLSIINVACVFSWMDLARAVCVMYVESITAQMQADCLRPLL